jgi:two-component system, OmpR family, sensor histidine kinase ArlS
VLTGSPTLQTAVRTMKDGAVDYLTKPFTAEQLQALVARCLTNRRIREELDHEKSIRVELEAAYAQLRKVQKLQDAFMSRVSHELRTPLAIASGRLSLVDQRLKGVDQENVAKARKALGQLDNVVADLLTFSELLKEDRALVLEPVDLRALLKELLKEYAALFEKKEVELKLELKDGLIAKADRSSMRDALRHLVTNAALFNSFRGFARFSGQKLGGSIHLEFENSGMVLPAEQSELIFDSFYQVAEALTREVGGLGLGLTIVRRILENHGGSIRAVPRDGGGAKFNMDLPAA